MVVYRKITRGGGGAAVMRWGLTGGERTVAGGGGSGEPLAETVAHENQARIFFLRVWERRGSPDETPAPDSSRRHEHTGGLEIARNPMVREISTIY